MNIVSFYAPRPEHPFFQDYRPFLALLRESCARFGHNHLVLTDDPMEIGGDDAYVMDLPRSLMKATRAAQLAYLNDPAMAGVPTLFVGADCVLAKDPAAFQAYDCDVAVTVGDFADCRINTGAIYVRDPALVRDVWTDALARCDDEWGDDQTSFEAALTDRQWNGRFVPKVCDLPVDPYNLAPEHPSDDCRRGIVLHFRGPRKRWMVDYCHKWLGLGEGVSLKLGANTPVADVMANIRSNMARKLTIVRRRDAHDAHAVLVGGGPSLASALDEIKRRAGGGQTIFALNGACSWLLDHGVHPHYGVVLDPRPENAKFLTSSEGGRVNMPRVAWLVASQCHPSVAASAYANVYLWHFADPELRETIAALDPNGEAVGGGITVGLTAMGLAYHMGYRKLHLYGYDSSDSGADGHAYAQAESAAESRRMQAWCNGQSFSCSPAMYAQAEAFERWADTLADAGAVITVHGDGLLPTIARQMQRAEPISQELAA